MPTTKLEVQLSLNDQLRRGFTKAGSEVRKFANRTRSIFRRINRSILGLQGVAAGLGAALTIGGIAKLTTSVAESADAIGKLSDRLGLSTEFLSEFRFVAGQTGVDAKTLDLSLQRVTRRFGEIARTGRGTALPALRELGSDLVAAVERGKSFEELLPIIAERLRAVEDPAKRLSIAFQLFDSEGAKLVQTLGLGAEGIEALRKQARSLGLTIRGDAAQSAREFNDEIDVLKKTFVGFLNDAILPLLPELTAFSVTLRTTIADIKKSIPTLTILLDRELSLATKLALIAAQRKKAQFDLGASIAAGLTPGGGAGEDEPADAFQLFLQESARQRDAARAGGPKQIGEQFKQANEDANGLRVTVEDTGDATLNLSSSLVGVSEGVEDLREQFSGFNVARNAINEIGNSLANNISSNLSAIVDGTKSAKQAFTDMATGIIADLSRIIIKALVARAIGIALGDPTGTTTGGVASFASGGFVPAGRTQRAVLHGPELVVPLNRQFDPSGVGGAGGGSTTVINITAIDVADFDRKMAASMKRQDTATAGIVVGAARSNQGLRNSFANI